MLGKVSILKPIPVLVIRAIDASAEEMGFMVI